MPFRSLDNWNSLLDKFIPSQKDIYYREEYVKLYKTENDQPTCFVFNKGDKYLLFPYLLRPFEISGVCYYDFETAYGYGGPISNTDDQEFISEALHSFYHYGQLNHYVAGFVRFHPLLDNTSCFDSIGQVIVDRHTIAIDLQGDIDVVWMNEIHTKNRNIIKKGDKNELTFFADYQYDNIEKFICLYNGTMDKLSADSFYYFDDDYYYRMKKDIPNSFLGVVLHGDKIISSAIFFYSEDYGHYHLSGSDKEALNLSPNSYMLWEAAKELKKHNVRKFHLGGGTDSDEHNSLFEFKRKFSKSLYSFKIGKIIFNPDVYAKLCIDWERDNQAKKKCYNSLLLKYKY